MIACTFNADQFAADLDDRSRRQIPYATMLTLNRTLVLMRDASRAQARRVTRPASAAGARFVDLNFTLDRPGGPMWARKDRLRITFGLGDHMGKQRRYTMLHLLEDGAPRTPGAGERYAGVGPAVAVPLIPKPVPRELLPASLGLRDTRRGYGSMKGSARGSQRSFIVTANGESIVLQRIAAGRARSSKRALYVLKPAVSVPRRPFFMEPMQKAYDAHVRTQWEQAWTEAMATAR